MSVSVDNVLGWGECRSAPTPGGCPSALRAISTIIAANATDRAFLEVHPSDLASLVPALPGWEQVWFREFALVERWLVSRPRALPFEPPSL